MDKINPLQEKRKMENELNQIKMLNEIPLGYIFLITLLVQGLTAFLNGFLLGYYWKKKNAE